MVGSINPAWKGATDKATFLFASSICLVLSKHVAFQIDVHVYHVKCVYNIGKIENSNVHRFAKKSSGIIKIVMVEKFP